MGSRGQAQVSAPKFGMRPLVERIRTSVDSEYHTVF